MLDTSARLLRLLSLLQSRREWASADLAERLGVAVRTVRRDVGRLRSLGYPVHATLGVGGGYRLGAGAAMPPLLLDDEEAVAVAVGLRTAAGGSVAGIEEASVRALAKLEQVLPSRLRHRVNTLHSATTAITGRGPVVSAQVLTEVADACRRQEGLRFDYTDHTGVAGLRAVEPHRLVFGGRRWYLLAWDLDRRDWRTFRVDRIALRTPSGPRFTPRDVPDGDAATYVRRTVSSAGWRYHARVRVHAPAAVLAGRLPPAAVLEAVDERTCMLDTGADTLEALAAHLGTLGVDFDVSHPPELLAQLRELADRCTRATQQP